MRLAALMGASYPRILMRRSHRCWCALPMVLSIPWDPFKVFADTDAKIVHSGFGGQGSGMEGVLLVDSVDLLGRWRDCHSHIYLC